MTYDRFFEPKRARRIRDRERMIARGTRYQSHIYPKPYGKPGEGQEWRDLNGNLHVGFATWGDVLARRKMVGTVSADNLAVCSCHMCGNPRRHWRELTIQELQAIESAKSQYVEAGLPPKIGRTCT